MKTIELADLYERAKSRPAGYVQDVLGRASQVTATDYTISEAVWGELARKYRKAPGRPRTGPGSQLKRMLGRLRIFGGVSCQCLARARLMDARGVRWCKDNVDVIVGWLKEEAAARRLPFMEFAARLLVRRAIRLAVEAERIEHTSTTVQAAVEGQ